jgi:hypothetical protein
MCQKCSSSCRSANAEGEKIILLWIQKCHIIIHVTYRNASMNKIQINGGNLCTVVTMENSLNTGRSCDSLQQITQPLQQQRETHSLCQLFQCMTGPAALSTSQQANKSWKKYPHMHSMHHCNNCTLTHWSPIITLSKFIYILLTVFYPEQGHPQIYVRIFTLLFTQVSYMNTGFNV